jgi:hypothetical protein
MGLTMIILGLNARPRETYPALMALDSEKCRDSDTLRTNAAGVFPMPPGHTARGVRVLRLSGSHPRPGLDTNPGEGAPLMRVDPSLDRNFRDGR